MGWDGMHQTFFFLCTSNRFSKSLDVKAERLPSSFSVASFKMIMSTWADSGRREREGGEERGARRPFLLWETSWRSDLSLIFSSIKEDLMMDRDEISSLLNEGMR